MKYAALIYDSAATEEPNTEEFGEVMQAYQAFGEKYGQQIKAGEALLPVETATSVQVRNGEVLTTDGPFAETKETLGGFYILDCENLDAAVQAAAEIPGALHGTVEVRPVMELPEN